MEVTSTHTSNVMPYESGACLSFTQAMPIDQECMLQVGRVYWAVGVCLCDCTAGTCLVMGREDAVLAAPLFQIDTSLTNLICTINPTT
eukprot:1161658-Pelagomonas_calceolata.AAC.11